MPIAEMLGRAAAELALFAGVGFLLFGINDLLVDLIYFARAMWRRLTVYSRNPRFYASQFVFNRKPGFVAMLVPAWDESWLPRLRAARTEAMAADGALLASDADPIHPMRVYGELARLLDEDAVVIGDGGDFVSYAGKYVEPKRPGGWLDPGPYGCLGTGLGYAIAARIARPQAQVVLLLGDGAAGFSLMDADTLVRHRLPVVMICGNNGAWGLEKHPMQALYGYDVAADLQPRCRYDEVVRALGGAGEIVTRPDGITPALRRAFDSGVPYLVNVITDPAIAYPRSTTGI